RVPGELVERRPAPHVARDLLDDADVAELAPHGRGRLVGILAPLDAVADGHRQVAADLVVELLVTPSPRPARAPHARPPASDELMSRSSMRSGSFMGRSFHDRMWDVDNLHPNPVECLLP